MAPRPRVGHLLHSLDRAGAEVLAADLAHGLRDRIECVFFCLDRLGSIGQTLREHGFAVHSFHRRPGLDARLIRDLARARRDHGLALWHVHQYTPFAYATLARLRAGRRERHLPILFTEHGRNYPDITRLRRRLANRLLLRRQDRVTAVGQFVAEALVQHEAIPRRRIQVIHNGIAAAPLAGDPAADRAAHHAARRLLADALPELPEDAAIIMQVARFHPVKDHATALRAFARIAPQTPRAHLLLIGDGVARHDMQQLAAALGLTGRAHFLGERADVRSLLPAATLFLLSSLSEGVSVTLLEAMAAHRPIVATDVGGNAEVVIHEETGLLAPRQDDATLARHLQTLLDDPSLARRMGDAGHRRFAQYFTRDAMHARYAAIYADMLGLTPARTLPATLDTPARRTAPPHPRSAA